MAPGSAPPPPPPPPPSRGGPRRSRARTEPIPVPYDGLPVSADVDEEGDFLFFVDPGSEDPGSDVAPDPGARAGQGIEEPSRVDLDPHLCGSQRRRLYRSCTVW